ncbi:MAG: hypothetical protein ACR2KL_09200 [Nocardioidaceae bacterium]
MPTPSRVPSQLRERPFTVSQALELGVSPRVLDGRRFRRPFRGVRAWHELPDDPSGRFDAARLVLPPSAIAGHLTAAKLWGLPVPDDPSTSVWVPWSCGGIGVEGVTVHRWCERPAATQLKGQPVTTAARTFADCAGLLGLVDLVTLGDAAVRQGLTSPDRLRVATGMTTRRHIRAAREAADLVRPGVDSAPETRTRLLLVLAGLPEPEVGRDVHLPDGGWLARPDLSYPACRIAIEYDGRHHADDPRQWRRDIFRRENLAAAEWLVIQVTAYDLHVRPLTVISRVLAALHRRGHPRAPLQPTWAWQPHFS